MLPASHPPHPTTIFMTVHKGASTFATHGVVPLAMRHYPDIEHRQYGPLVAAGSTAGEHPLPPSNVFATRVYPWTYDDLVEDPVPAAGRFTDKKLVVMRRDPRDVAISGFYSRAFSHPVPERGRDEFVRQRNELRSLGVVEGVRRHCARSAIDEFRAATAILARFEHALDAPYELLVTRPLDWLDLVATYLGWPRAVIDDLAGKVPPHVTAPDTEQPTKHKRRVTPGNWRSVFDDGLDRVFTDEIGPEMASAGYDAASSGRLARAA
ncbi:MAG: hypothetical protein GY715_12275 [Planctomycetes bacterium]|nr:hypothetical protein [Planctomycetota bacterium]